MGRTDVAAERTDWHRHLGPGWLAAYALGLLGWLAIWRLWSAVVVVALIAGGGLGIVWLGNKLDSGEFPPPEDR